MYRGEGSLEHSRSIQLSPTPQKLIYPICWETLLGAPTLGLAERGHPDLFRFVPICSPFSADLFRFALLLFGNAPICSDLLRFAPISSDLFRFVFRTNQNKSGKPLSADPFCKSLTCEHFSCFSFVFSFLISSPMALLLFSGFSVSRVSALASTAKWAQNNFGNFQFFPFCC